MDPLVSCGLNSRMAGGHLQLTAGHEAVAVGGDIMLGVPLAAFSQLDLRAVGIGRPEVRNFDETALYIGVILNGEGGTGRSGLVTPMPACNKLLLLCVLEDQLRVTFEGVG
jgi:hypothetical protein